MTTPITVLVVDDDGRARAALVRALDDCEDLRAVGLDMDQAGRLASRPAVADAAVVDLPHVSPEGLDLVTRFARRMPVVVTSLSGAAAAPSREAGAGAFLEKDGDGDELIARIRAHVRGAIAQNAAGSGAGDGRAG